MLNVLHTVAEATHSYTTSTSSSGGTGVVGLLLVYLAVLVFVLVGVWKVFTKAGKPGWASIVPIYNVWVMLKIAGKPDWWLLLMFIPIVNIVVGFAVYIEIAKRFGKSAAFGVFALGFFGFIGWPILGFGKAQYSDTSSGAAGTPNNNYTPAAGSPLAQVAPAPVAPTPSEPVQPVAPTVVSGGDQTNQQQ